MGSARKVGLGPEVVSDTLTIRYTVILFHVNLENIRRMFIHTVKLWSKGPSQRGNPPLRYIVLSPDICILDHYSLWEKNYQS